MDKTTRGIGLRLRRGAVLLQTLVISVIISMIAVMVMKWVLARYTIATRIQRSAKNEARSDGCMNHSVSRRLTETTILNCNDVDGIISRSFSSADAQGIETLTVRINE
ncbi:MAG: hypothetical protein RQ748_05395 [Elusimicrobiales bacterium]|nr:hypothetical protein [Elusimicrobiales bacterium]